jgi:hypothetical protein
MRTSQLDLKIRTGKTRHQLKIRLRRDHATFLLDLDPNDRGLWLDAVIDESRKLFSFSEICRAHHELELSLQVLLHHFHVNYQIQPPPAELIRLFEILKIVTYAKPAAKSHHRKKD